MKTEKLSGVSLRLVCWLLALLTLLAVVPSFSVNANAETTAYDEYVSFDETDVTSDTGTLDSSNFKNILSSGLSLTCTGYITPIASKDPKDETNTVVYNNNDGKAFLMKLNESSSNLRLHTTDFVISADFMFEAFPTTSDGVASAVSLLAWVQNEGQGDQNYMTFCNVNNSGKLLKGSGSTATGVVFTLGEWKNVVVHCDGESGAYDVYVDGAFVFSGDCGTPLTSPTSSYLRLLNSNKYLKAYVDDIQLYETPRVVDVAYDNVIWDVDFEEFKADVTPTATQINSMSSVAKIDTTSSAWTNSTYASIVEETDEDGNVINKQIKMSGLTNAQSVALFVGNENFDPLKNGSVKLSFDFTYKKQEGATQSSIALVRWRSTKYNTASTKNHFTIVNLTADGVVQLRSGNSTDYKLEEGRKYSFEVIFNNQIIKNTQYIDITLNVDDGTGMKTIGDSFTDWDSSTTEPSAVTGVNYAYFLDGEGVKRYMPYTGIIKKARTVNSSTVNIDRLVIGETTPTPISLRLFHSANSTGSCGMDLYVDNLKIEKIENQPIISFGFEGWQNYSFTAENTNYRFNPGAGSIKTADGNVYFNMPSNTSSNRQFYVGDRDHNFMGKNVYLETDIYFPAESTSTVSPSQLMSLQMKRKGAATETDPFAWEAKVGDVEQTLYTHLLYADGKGNLYSSSSTSNILAEGLTVGGWTKVGINLSGDGNYWNTINVYIDGELVYSGTVSTGNQKLSAAYSFRFRGIVNAAVGYDNISITDFVPEEPKAEDFTLGFEDETELKTARERLGSSWQYGEIGSERVTLLERTVGDNVDKYLRINHSGLTESQNAYVNFITEKFVSEDTYLIETSVRYTANTSFNLDVARAYRASDDTRATILSVRGGENSMFVNLRGITYDVVNSAGKLVYVSKTSDEAFTDVAILIDRVNETYTVYINGRLAYYDYDGEILPLVNMPMHFTAVGSTVASDRIRLLEVANTKYSDGIFDIGYINVISTPNGLGTEIKGSQTREISGKGENDNKYDVRFVSGLDTLYGSMVGFEIKVVYTEGENEAQTKNHEEASPLVYSSVEANNKVLTAENLDSKYLAAVEIYDIPMECKVTFTVKPYINRGGIKVYGKLYTVSFAAGEIVE